VLEGENRERALEVFRHMGDDTPEMLLAAIEKEFVLVRPMVNEDGTCETFCGCYAEGDERDYCASHLDKIRVKSGEFWGSMRPGPDCPAHRKEKSGEEEQQ